MEGGGHVIIPEFAQRDWGKSRQNLR